MMMKYGFVVVHTILLFGSSVVQVVHAGSSKDCPSVKQVSFNDISVDGTIDEWDLDDTGLDFVGNMYTAGDSSKAIGGKLYARLDCDTSTLCIMVNSQDDTTFENDEDEIWFKNYDISSNTQTPIGNGIVTVLNDDGDVIAWEACYSVPTTGVLDNFEVHTNFYTDGAHGNPDTASTGKEGNSICIDLTCDKCYLPAGTHAFSLITEEGADVAAHNVYSGVAIGDTFEDTYPQSSIVVSAHSPYPKSYVGSLANSNNVEFKGGVETGSTNLNDDVISFDHFKWLALNAKSSTSGNYKVVVVNYGGEFDMYDFRNGGQGEDNGVTLAIFNTDETITLTKTSDGRQFGPSVIAPFAHVILDGNAGFIDGFVVAKSFETLNNNPSNLQMHGDMYTGPIECVDVEVPLPTSPPTPAPVSDTDSPTRAPTIGPTSIPTKPPTSSPTKGPTPSPTKSPTSVPTNAPTLAPTKSQTGSPTVSPSVNPTGSPTKNPTASPSGSPTESPTDEPTEVPTESPTSLPTRVPTSLPTDGPTTSPTTGPTKLPTTSPTGHPTASPTAGPTGSPTGSPTAEPTASPTTAPTEAPTTGPTASPTGGPTSLPTLNPTQSPTGGPSAGPTVGPTEAPTAGPTASPTSGPTSQPTSKPTGGPTDSPSGGPTGIPTSLPTVGPTTNPTSAPSGGPTDTVTSVPTGGPTSHPTGAPSGGPTGIPTASPTGGPTTGPTSSPTGAPSLAPIPTNLCPEDVELVAVVGETQYPEVPILIEEQSTTQVTFRVHNSFTAAVEALYVQYHSNDLGNYDCVGDGPVQRGEYSTYTAYCMKNCPITIVELWGSDSGVFVGSDNAVVPECCKPFTDHDLPAVQYTFKIYCDSQCPPDENEDNLRRLHKATQTVGDYETFERDVAEAREMPIVSDQSDESYSDSHFCLATEYPCGNDGKNVHVCHYSTRSGYQTFCVTESDSDVMSFYPRDYCGPCIGGYGAHSAHSVIETM